MNVEPGENREEAKIEDAKRKFRNVNANLKAMEDDLGKR